MKIEWAPDRKSLTITEVSIDRGVELDDVENLIRICNIARDSISDPDLREFAQSFGMMLAIGPIEKE